MNGVVMVASYAHQHRLFLIKAYLIITAYEFLTC